jgi:hypothetical protein
MTPTLPPGLDLIVAYPWLLALLADPIGPIIEWTCWTIAAAGTAWLVWYCWPRRAGI